MTVRCGKQPGVLNQMRGSNHVFIDGSVCKTTMASVLRLIAFLAFLMLFAGLVESRACP